MRNDAPAVVFGQDLQHRGFTVNLDALTAVQTTQLG